MPEKESKRSPNHAVVILVSLAIAGLIVGSMPLAAGLAGTLAAFAMTFGMTVSGAYFVVVKSKKKKLFFLALCIVLFVMLFIG